MKTGFKSKKGKLVHDLMKKGYTKAHLKNSKSEKFKNFDHAVRLHTGIQPGLEEGDNNFTVQEEEQNG